MTRRTQLTLLAAGTLIVALASTAWWLSSPQGARRAGLAIVLLVGSIYAVEQWRRLTPQSRQSPLVLGAALVGLGVPYLTMRMGPIFPTVLAVAVALAWTSVAIARAVPPSLWLRRTQTPTREG